jgi:ABC-2 type transport system permease protein
VRPVLLLVAKDLRVLRRTPVLLAILVLYPLMIAALVGLVAGYASSKPRVAFVDEDGLPAVLTLAGHRFDVQATIDRVSTEVRLVRLDADEARRQLENGKVIATVTVPPGFVARLKVMVQSPRLELETSKGGLSDRVRQQVQALVFNLNRQLQQAYIDANLRYVKLIREGGRGDFLGRHFELLGLGGAERLLREQPAGPARDRILEFVRTARLALNQTDDALRATAHPIELVEAPERGRTAVLSAQVQGYALALTLAFLALVLAAGSLAGERDENVLGRLARGLVSPGRLIAAKIVLAAVVSAALGLGVALAFGLVIEAGGVTGGEPWTRMPLLAPALLLAGAALGALGTLLGALSREARTASLVSLLVVLPVVFLGLVPREVFPLAGWVSDGLPFAHGRRLFSAALYDLSPWPSVGREAAWLAGLTLLYAGAARLGMRRFLA